MRTVMLLVTASLVLGAQSMDDLQGAAKHAANQKRVAAKAKVQKAIATPSAL